MIRKATYTFLLLFGASAVMWTDFNPLMLWEPYVRWLNAPNNYVLYTWVLGSFTTAATSEIWSTLLFPDGHLP